MTFRVFRRPGQPRLAAPEPRLAQSAGVQLRAERQRRGQVGFVQRALGQATENDALRLPRQPQGSEPPAAEGHHLYGAAGRPRGYEELFAAL